MATIIYDAKQGRAINLDNVDSIILSDEDGKNFKISFEKRLVAKDRAFNSTIEFWEYDTADERDTVYNTIIQKHGENVNHQGSIVL